MNPYPNHLSLSQIYFLKTRGLVFKDPSSVFKGTVCFCVFSPCPLCHTHLAVMKLVPHYVVSVVFSKLYNQAKYPQKLTASKGLKDVFGACVKDHTLWFINIDGDGPGYGLRIRFQTRCYIVLCRTFHIAQTGIPTPYFCIGQESKSPYQSPSPAM